MDDTGATPAAADLTLWLNGTDTPQDLRHAVALGLGPRSSAVVARLP